MDHKFSFSDPVTAAQKQQQGATEAAAVADRSTSSTWRRRTKMTLQLTFLTAFVFVAWRVLLVLIFKVEDQHGKTVFFFSGRFGLH